MIDPEAVARAAEAVDEAAAVVVTAGAGMGVDSGLPDFRGPEGFWRAYPPYRKLGLAFEDMANPRWFSDDPALAWGFYGHRLALYRKTTPHAGFAVLRRFAERAAHGAFVFTSNVDGQFAHAGFDEARILEVHGAIEWLQCCAAGEHGLWPAPADDVDVDASTFRARGRLPTCSRCGALARPNILMFNDAGWLEDRSAEQTARFEEWIAGVDGRLVVVECGAGPALPTVRRFGERLARQRGATLVRINVRDPEVPAGIDAVALAAGAKEALLAVESHLAAAATTSR